MRETELRSADKVLAQIKEIETWLDTDPLNKGNQFYAGERSGLLDTVNYIADLESALAAERARADTLARALEFYAEESNWTKEATFQYETGIVRSDGYAEESTGHVDLDTECVWNGEGNNGYEIAKAALSDWRTARGAQP